ncbi:MAG: hypothetical protein ABFC96_01310 [Thermoguttaceae bacterium]
MPVAILMLAAALGVSANASAAPKAARQPVVETIVGMEGVYYLRHRGPPIEAVPVDDNSPMVLRIAETTTDGDTAICELRYIGVKPGRYDLRSYLRRVDGSPLVGVESIPVTVRSILPASHNGQLDELPRPPLPTAWPYRLSLAVLVAFWLLPVVWFTARLLVRRRPRARQTSLAEPTLADQLRPLVEAAMAGRLSTADQARLELMIIAYWRERLELTECTAAEAMTRLHEHPESAAPIEQLEQWLHRRPGTCQVDVAAALEPYRDHLPMLVISPSVVRDVKCPDSHPTKAAAEESLA